MHTERPLFARVTHPDNLLNAWKRVAAKRSAGGSDGVSVDDFACALDRNLQMLREDLLDERYVPEPLQQIEVPKGNGTNERRPLRLPSVRDKIVQEAVRSVIEPTLNRMFLDCSYGYRPGKGPQRAVARVTDYLGPRKRRWAVTADIDNFFGSLDQTLLLDRLRSAIPDEAVLRLVHLWLRMGAVDGRGRWRDVYSGIGQGGVISPLLANFYLHPFDEHLVGAGLGLVRYADDLVILCATREEGDAALVKATRQLEALGLRLNPNPRPVASVDDGFGFLGIFFQGNQRCVESGKLDQMRAKAARVGGHPDVPRAIRGLNEAAAGWRRYYGVLVVKEDLDKIQEIVGQALIDVVARAFRRKQWKGLEDAERALAHVETPAVLDAGKRRELLARIAREGRARAEERRIAPASPTTGNGGAPPATPGSPDRVPTRAMARPGRRGESVATTVRRSRRQHQRQLSDVSELVINTPGTFLGRSSQRVFVRRDRRTVCEVPFARLTGITLAARGVSVSTDLVEQCAERDIPILLLSGPGKVSAVVSAPDSARNSVGVLQLEALATGRAAFSIARRFIEGKIRNQASLLKYLGKYRGRVHGGLGPALPEALAAMRARVDDILALAGALPEDWRNHLFSIEGRAAQEYWRMVKAVLPPRVPFEGRERRGATDLVNSMLNYGYAVLQARVHVAVLRAGLAPQLGFLHALQRNGAPALVFDLMEEFRAHVVDRTVLTLLARREPVAVDAEGLLTAEARCRLIAQIYARLATVVRFRGKDLTLEEIVRHQAQLLARHLKGEAPYRPFLAKW